MIADIAFLIPVSKKRLWLIQLAFLTLPELINCGPGYSCVTLYKYDFSSFIHMEKVLFSEKQEMGNWACKSISVLTSFFLTTVFQPIKYLAIIQM